RGGKMLPAENAMRVLIQNLPHRRVVIFAAETNQKTLLGNRENLRLEAIVRDARILVGIQLNSFQTGLADNAAPNRVVAIEDQHFFGRQQPAFENANDLGGGGFNKLGPKRSFVHQTEALVHRGSLPESGGNSFEVEQPAPIRPLCDEVPENRIQLERRG